MFESQWGNKIVVEPVKSPNAAGGVRWAIRTGPGGTLSRHNYKDTAVKKARQKARGQNGELVVKNKDMSVSERRDYS